MNKHLHHRQLEGIFALWLHLFNVSKPLSLEGIFVNYYLDSLLLLSSFVLYF